MKLFSMVRRPRDKQPHVTRTRSRVAADLDTEGEPTFTFFLADSSPDGIVRGSNYISSTLTV